MRIQDLERRTGLDRAAIRFYEREGLIRPEHAENCYREYSEEDADHLWVMGIRLEYFSYQLHTSAVVMDWDDQTEVTYSALGCKRKSAPCRICLYHLKTYVEQWDQAVTEGTGEILCGDEAVRWQIEAEKCENLGGIYYCQDENAQSSRSLQFEIIFITIHLTRTAPNPTERCFAAIAEKDIDSC